ncbi:MAG: hypothetical protein KC502_00070 [Myxococcales bacterium]|nr:hypothetical protein [Myxococcales bacterium]
MAAASVVVGLVTLLAWWPVLECGWFWDDRGTFVANPWLHSPDFFAESLRPHLGHWQPLTWWSLRLDELLWPQMALPKAHLLGNVLLHGLTAILLLRVLALVLRHHERRFSVSVQVGVAALGALAWALHPCRVESVAWATERRDMLAVCLVVGGLLCWLHAQSHRFESDPSPDEQTPNSRLWLAAAAVLWGLSALAKAWVIALPGALIALEIGLFAGWQRHNRWLTIRRAAPWFVIAIPAALVAAWAQHAAGATSDGALGITERIVGAGHHLMAYLALTVLPLQLSPLHPIVAGTTLDTAHVAGWIGAVSLTGLLFWRGRSSPAALGAWLGFAAWLLPVLGLLQSGVQAIAERYLILAHIPLIIFAATIVAAWFADRRKGLMVLAVLVVLGWTGRMVQWQGVWRAGPEALWSAAIAGEPKSIHARINRGALRLGRGADPENDLAVALALSPNNATAWKLNAEHLRRQGRTKEALAALLRAAKLAPDDLAVRCNLGGLLAQSGDRSKATLVLNSAITDGGGVDCLLNRAVLRANSGDRKGAAADVRAALAQLPANHPQRQRAEGMARALGISAPKRATP